MAYTALARKWRPKKFAELVGQEHVRRALVNALESGRVHHAFLFTGTRGVGKTTIARIFAKCLNCESGVTAQPCGECAACREIDSGRFIDLIEVDAASRTKVDDTRELLDNVQYSPTRGRYKVYLIDEVHMLSTHSFNALLKTLEEPPPHVKFLLATTDPQKLPVTVLSRCLQFNLKRLPVAQIAERMRQILDIEGIAYEAAGLRLLAQAADGSVRDGLSLLDQLIAFGAGRAGEEEARAMLGTISRDHIVRLAGLLAESNVPALMRCAQSLEEFAPDYAQLLDELASLLVRVALRQAVPDYEGDDLYEPQLLERLAKLLSPEDVQLFYQTAIVGRRDLALAPDPRTGFEMTLVRMIAFRPAPEAARVPEAQIPSGPAPATSGRSGASGSSGSSAARAAALGATAARSGAAVTSQAAPDRPGPGTRASAADPASTTARSPAGSDSGQAQSEERRKSAAPGAHLSASGATAGSRAPAGQPDGEVSRSGGGGASAAGAENTASQRSAGTASGAFPGPSAAWTAILGQLDLTGMAKQLAGNCLLIGKQGALVRLALDPRSRSLDTPALKDKLAQALSKHFGEPVVLEIETAVAGTTTPAASEQRSSQEELESARRAFEADPGVQGLRERFGATLLPDTVRPVKS